MITHNHIKKIFLFTLVLFIAASVNAQKITNTEITKNVQKIEGSLEKIAKLNPTVFEYDTKKFKHLNLNHGVQYGFIADEIQLIFPELVTEKTISYMFGKNTYRNTTIKIVDEQRLVPLLVASVKELQAQVESLKEELEKVKTGNKVAVK